MNAATRIDFTVVSIVVWTHSKALGPMILTLQRRNGCRSGAESIACCKPSISPYPGIAVLTVTGTTHSHGPPAGPAARRLLWQVWQRHSSAGCNCRCTLRLAAAGRSGLEYYGTRTRVLEYCIVGPAPNYSRVESQRRGHARRAVYTDTRS